MPGRGMFTSERSDWRTPRAFRAGLEAEFHFDFDPCPTGHTFDGLAIEWGDRNFVNPPYGRQIGKWVDKAKEQAAKGRLVVMLVPARTDTVWWHNLMDAASEIRFIPRRLRFDERGRKSDLPVGSRGAGKSAGEDAMILTDGLHLITDNGLDELHRFARRIGLRRSWFQDHPRYPHYDMLSPRVRGRALMYGAQVVPTKTIVEICRAKGLQP